MKKIDALRTVTTKPELARLLGIKASMLTYVLYVLRPETQYSIFEIPKKSGGTRTISAPHDKLKSIQRALADLLQDCIEDINDSKPKSAVKSKFINSKKMIIQIIGKQNFLRMCLRQLFRMVSYGSVR
ncbi:MULTISPECIES: hypothetical protein [Pseudomonas syringae group]|uniref:hypothetical protein n=1 Tax=Pseudomonas syringae group TaxID=136849 RepID=UPI0019681ADE|nr:MULTISPECIES: hypothetical protein [Pseudomonas syringae group]